jgi:hypothetical protein
MVVAPSGQSRLPDHLFTSLVSDLTTNALLEPPFTVIQGDLTPYPLSLWQYPAKGVGDYGKVRVTFHGDDAASLLKEVERLLGQDRDFCIFFHGFNLNNRQLAESFDALGYFNADVVLYSLRTAQPIEIEYFRLFEGELERGETVRFQVNLSQYLCSMAKGGPEAVADTTLEQVLFKHFGRDMQVHCSYW